VGGYARRHGPAQGNAGYSRKKLIALIGWHRSQADAQKLREQGFGDLIGEKPDLCPASQEAWLCWQFCGGWAPQTWPVYLALYGSADWSMVVELMQEIRRNV
jgi:hypothetical protein